MDRQSRLYVAGGLNKANPPFETADKFKGGVYVLWPEGGLLDFRAEDAFHHCGGTLWSIRVR